MHPFKPGDEVIAVDGGVHCRNGNRYVIREAYTLVDGGEHFVRINGLLSGVYAWRFRRAYPDTAFHESFKEYIRQELGE